MACKIILFHKFQFSILQLFFPPPWLQLNTESENERPVLLQPLGLIFAEQGRLLEFDISQNVFCDREDGDTENLTLSIQFPSGQKLLSNLWLYLDVENQVRISIFCAEIFRLSCFHLFVTASTREKIKN